MEEPALPARVEMIRAPFVLLVLLSLAAGVLGAAQQPTYRSSVPTVSVYATVLDRTGRLVTDLTADDFELYDNGRRQPLTLFDNSERPITVVLMLDRSISMRPQFGLLSSAARAFVSTLLPEDRVRIGSFSDRIRIDPDGFTSDRQELNQIIEHRLLPAGSTPLWNATFDALDALKAEVGQRVVLVFTDGRDTPALGRSVSFREVLARVRTEEPMVYAVGLSFVCEDARRRSGGGRGWPGPLFQAARDAQFPGPRGPQFPRPPGPVPFPGGGLPPRQPGAGPAPPDPRRQAFSDCRNTAPDPDLREVAEAGGGGYFELESADNLTSTFRRVAHELHSQYLLAFVAPELDGQLHTLEVRTKRAGLTVRARRSYLASGE